MKRGRPFGSQIRQNILDLLNVMKKGYGYDIYKNYIRIFPKVTMRSIYYHLKKGIDLGEIELMEVKSESGDYSWGSTVEKTYYKLGKSAKPKDNKLVNDFFGKKH